MKLLILVFLLMLVSACQVEQKKAGDELLSGHTSTTNKFTPDAVTSGSYKSGDTITFGLNFPFIVTVAGGAPRLTLDVGGVTQYANYISGNGSKKLVFEYTVAASMNDTDGISVTSSVDLNGSTLKFTSNSVVTDCGLSFTSPSTSAVLVDTTAPTQDSLSYSPANLYVLNDTILATVVYSEPVVVTGSPRIILDVGGVTKYATYVSGSNSASLIFSYTVVSGDKDLNGVGISSASLNSGTINDRAGITAPFSLSASTMTNVLVQDVPTRVSSVTMPTNGIYLSGQTLTFSLVFSRTMTVTGSPRFPLTIGASGKYATYASGTGTNTLVFSYTVANPDYDVDGIGVTSTLALNSGTLTDSNGDPLIIMAFTAGSSSSINVDAVIPTISTLTPPSNATYLVGQNMNFTAVFSHAVTVVGTPSIDFVLGSTTVHANYVSGSGTTSLLFRYIPISGDFDSNGIAIGTLELNSGTIQSAVGNNADLTLPVVNTSGVLVNGVNPTISTFTAPSNGTYLETNDMNFTVVFSSAVTVIGSPSVTFATTNGSRSAIYLSGSGTSTLIFRYTVASGVYDYDGIVVSSPLALNGGSIRDSNGYDSVLTFTVPTTTGVLVDASPAVINSVTVPSSRTYGDGEILNFTYAFSKSVTVTGTPRVSITMGGATVYANYFSGSGTTSLVFRKVIANPDTDADGIAIISPIGLNGGTIRDSNTINATLTYSVPNTSGIVVDSIGPTVSSITAPANATYKTNQNLNFIVDFSENVIVTGTPRLVLNIGGTTRYANYLSGSGTTSLTFRHTVLSGDLDSNGLGITSAIDLNSGTLLDAISNSATLTFTAPNLASVNVDAILPTISTVSLPANGVYTTAGQLNFTINFNKAITVTGTPRLVLTIGSSTVYANYVSGSGSTALLFRHTIAASSFDLNGIALANSNDIDLNGGTMVDVVSNNAPLNLGAQVLSSVNVSYPGMGAWYDSNDAATMTTVFSSPNYQISALTDKSGGARNTTQTTGTNRPYYLSSGFGSQNRASMNTNVATHHLNITSAIPLIQYVIIVFRTPSTLGTATVFSSSAASMSMTASGTLNMAPTAQWKINGGSLQTTTTATPAATLAGSSNYIVSIRYASGVTATAQRLGHASASMINGQIAEALFFTSSASLTDTELTIIHNYLNAKYGIY